MGILAVKAFLISINPGMVSAFSEICSHLTGLHRFPIESSRISNRAPVRKRSEVNLVDQRVKSREEFLKRRRFG